MIGEAEKKIVDEAVSKLSEFFDSVRIFVTSHEGATDQTKAYENGAGNFYAQQGQIEEWLTIQKEYQRNYARRKDSQDEEV